MTVSVEHILVPLEIIIKGFQAFLPSHLSNKKNIPFVSRTHLDSIAGAPT